MPRQNFFKQIISTVIIFVFMAGCNAQVNVFTPTPPATTTVAAPADTDTPPAISSPTPTKDTLTPTPLATRVDTVTPQPVATEGLKPVELVQMPINDFVNKKDGIMQQAGFDLKKIPVDDLPVLGFGSLDDSGGTSLQTMLLRNNKRDAIKPLNVIEITGGSEAMYFVTLAYKTQNGETGVFGVFIDGKLDPIDWATRINKLLAGGEVCVIQLYTVFPEKELSLVSPDFEEVLSGTSATTDGADFNEPKDLGGGIFSGSISPFVD